MEIISEETNPFSREQNKSVCGGEGKVSILFFFWSELPQRANKKRQGVEESHAKSFQGRFKYNTQTAHHTTPFCYFLLLSVSLW